MSVSMCVCVKNSLLEKLVLFRLVQRSHVLVAWCDEFAF